MPREASGQAKWMHGLASWGQVLGTGCGSLENQSYCVSPTKSAICWRFLEPSDGLEPSTPSLPCVHDRSRETQFFLQIGLVLTPKMRRETCACRF
jgi:hypothetical protein